MKFQALLISLFLLSFGISAQENPEQEIPHVQSINLGLGGTGVFASASYDRIVNQNEKFFLDVSLGIGRVMFGGGTTFPYSASLNFGKERSFIEAGLGGTYWLRPDKVNALEEDFSWNALPIFGFKRYSTQHRFVFRAHVCPVFTIKGAYLSRKRFTPMAGMSLGMAF